MEIPTYLFEIVKNADVNAADKELFNRIDSFIGDYANTLSIAYIGVLLQELAISEASVEALAFITQGKELVRSLRARESRLNPRRIVGTAIYSHLREAETLSALGTTRVISSKPEPQFTDSLPKAVFMAGTLHSTKAHHLQAPKYFELLKIRKSDADMAVLHLGKMLVSLGVRS